MSNSYTIILIICMSASLLTGVKSVAVTSRLRALQANNNTVTVNGSNNDTVYWIQDLIQPCPIDDSNDTNLDVQNIIESAGQNLSNNTEALRAQIYSLTQAHNSFSQNNDQYEEILNLLLAVLKVEAANITLQTNLTKKATNDSQYSCYTSLPASIPVSDDCATILYATEGNLSNYLANALNGSTIGALYWIWAFLPQAPQIFEACASIPFTLVNRVFSGKNCNTSINTFNQALVDFKAGVPSSVLAIGASLPDLVGFCFGTQPNDVARAFSSRL